MWSEVVVNCLTTVLVQLHDAPSISGQLTVVLPRMVLRAAQRIGMTEAVEKLIPQIIRETWAGLHPGEQAHVPSPDSLPELRVCWDDSAYQGGCMLADFLVSACRRSWREGDGFFDPVLATRAVFVRDLTQATLANARQAGWL